MSLQKIDSQVWEVRKIAEALPLKQKEMASKLEIQQALLETKASELRTIQEDRRARQDLLKAEEDKLKKWEKRLMDSKNHREAAPLSREIDAQKRLNQETLEEIDKVLKDEQEREKAIHTLDTECSGLKADLDKETKTVDAKKKEVDDKMAAFEKQRVQFTKDLPPATLRRYDQIKERRGGLAIVPARAGCCVGCNMSLPPQLYNRLQNMHLQKSAGLENCPSCQRILYWEKGLEHGIS